MINMTMKHYLTILVSFLFILFSSSGIAASNNGQGTFLTAFISNDQPFDAAAANKVLNQVNAEIDSPSASATLLQQKISDLVKFQITARKCTDNNTALLNKITQRLTEISIPQAKAHALSEEQKYLNDKKSEVTNQLSECRLFLLRTTDISTALNQKVRVLVTSRLLYESPDIIANVKAIPEAIAQFYQSFNVSLLLQEGGIDFFRNNLLAAIVAVMFLFGGIVASIKAREYLASIIQHNVSPVFAQRVTQNLLSILRHYLPLLISAILLSLFFSLFTHSLRTPSYLALTSYAFLAYVIYNCLVRCIFYPPKPATILFVHLPAQLSKSLAKRLQIFGALVFIIYILFFFLQAQDIHHSLVGLYKTASIIALTLSIVAVLWIVTKLPILVNHHRITQIALRILLIGLLLFILFIRCLGYHLLSLYLLHGVVLTTLAIFVTRLAHRFIDAAFEYCKDMKQGWRLRLRYNLGLKYNERLVEVVCLELLCYLLLWFAFLLYLLKIWGLTETHFELVLNYLLYGSDIGQIKIVPSHILVGILSFIFLSLSTRWLRAYISRNSSWRMAQGSKEALASIVGYVGFAIAFIIGALVAGVNFSGLALIAGALSLGIGFGLQNIVNNFVSGLILLIERPIKPGDRIIVGDTEGYVRRISIRSTHIITTRHSDVIVPNSDLISKQVTNYMLYDKNYKVLTTVGIAYGSDVELAKKLLLEIAYANPQVVTDRKDQEPAVYFVKFGDSSLDFELYCLIKDIDLKYLVFSELNFAIEKTFREHGVVIAYPQREIKILNWPKEASTS